MLWIQYQIGGELKGTGWLLKVISRNNSDIKDEDLTKLPTGSLPSAPRERVFVLKQATINMLIMRQTGHFLFLLHCSAFSFYKGINVNLHDNAVTPIGFLQFDPAEVCV